MQVVQLSVFTAGCRGEDQYAEGIRSSSVGTLLCSLAWRSAAHYLGETLWKHAGCAQACVCSYLHTCVTTHMHLYVCLDCLAFPYSSREDTRQKPEGGGELGSDPRCAQRDFRSPRLSQLKMEINSSLALSPWSFFCTQWEPNKYFMRRSLNQGSQQLFPALTLRDPWGRSDMEPLGSPVFLIDPEVTPGPAVPEEAGSRFLHPSCFGGSWLFLDRFSLALSHSSCEYYLLNNHVC